LFFHKSHAKYIILAYLSLKSRSITSTIGPTAVGNSNGIKIDAREVEISNSSNINTTTSQSTPVIGKGNAGNIDISTTGNLIIIGTNNPIDLQGKDYNGLSGINTSTYGQGNTGKITIDTHQGKLLVSNRGGIFSQITPNAVGNSVGIKINAGELEISNISNIATTTSQSIAKVGTGKAGDINIITQGNLTISGTNNPANLTATNTTSKLKDGDGRVMGISCFSLEPLQEHYRSPNQHRGVAIDNSWWRTEDFPTLDTSITFSPIIYDNFN
jgi:hypothetical protein